LSLSEARKLENRLKRQGRGKGFTRLPVCIEAAHNPADCRIAGSNPASSTKFSCRARSSAQSSTPLNRARSDPE
jgi:hypothetical protein